MVKIGITEKKDENFSEWYTQTVLKAELIDYSQVKGFIILREYGFSIWENIQSILDKKFGEVTLKQLIGAARNR